MKTLIVYYSLTGKTKKLCRILKNTLGGSTTALKEVKERSIINAYTLGVIQARMHKASMTLPLETDISEYKQIIIAGPVWAGNPAPALNDFLQQHDLEGKRVYGLLTYAGSDVSNAKLFMEEMIAATNAQPKNVLAVCSSYQTILALNNGNMYFDLDEDENLCLVKKDSES